MRRAVARTFSIAILVLCVSSVIAASAIFISIDGEVPQDEIVVVGDPSAPRMQEVLDELSSSRRASWNATP